MMEQKGNKWVIFRGSKGDFTTQKIYATMVPNEGSLEMNQGKVCIFLVEKGNI